MMTIGTNSKTGDSPKRLHPPYYEEKDIFKEGGVKLKLENFAASCSFFLTLVETVDKIWQ